MVPVKLLLRKVQNVTQFTHGVLRGLAIKAQGPLSCHAGCAYCCYQKIVGGAFEGIAIYLWLREEGKWTPELRAKLAAADREMVIRTHRGHLMKRIPCAFLAEKSFGSGRCTIYPVRPLCCSGTFSTGKPSECSVPDASNTFAIRQDQIAELNLRMDRELLERFVGDPFRFVTLPGAVLLAEAAIETLPDPGLAAVVETKDAKTPYLVEEFNKLATVKDGE